MFCQSHRSSATKVTDVESDEQICKWLGLRTLDGVKELLHRNFGELVETLQLISVKRINISDVTEQAEFAKELHPLFAEPFDVHCAPRSEVLNRT